MSTESLSSDRLTKRRLLTPEQVDRLRFQVEQLGTPLDDLAADLNVSYDWLHRTIKALNIQPLTSTQRAAKRRSRELNERRLRLCLGCRSPFMSSWIGNRLGACCAPTAAEEGSVTEHALALLPRRTAL